MDVNSLFFSHKYRYTCSYTNLLFLSAIFSYFHEYLGLLHGQFWKENILALLFHSLVFDFGPMTENLRQTFSSFCIAQYQDSCSPMLQVIKILYSWSSKSLLLKKKICEPTKVVCSIRNLKWEAWLGVENVNKNLRFSPL